MYIFIKNFNPLCFPHESAVTLEFFLIFTHVQYFANVIEPYCKWSDSCYWGGFLGCAQLWAGSLLVVVKQLSGSTKYHRFFHGLRTPGEKILFAAWPKINCQSQIFRCSQSIFCLPHRHKFSDIFDGFIGCPWSVLVRPVQLTKSPDRPLVHQEILWFPNSPHMGFRQSCLF